MRPATLTWACAGLCAALACSDRPEAPAEAERGAGSDLLPCGVARVIEAHCAACHGAVQRSGAPLSLVRASDARQSWKGQTAGERMLARVRDDAQPMPPAPAARLTADEIALLRGWIEGGAAADPQGCAVRQAGDDAGAGSSAGDGGAPSAAGAGAEPIGEAQGSDWPMFGGDLENNRSSAGETRIGKATVARLARAWEFARASTSSVPVIVSGVVYVPTWDAKLHALSAATGTELWTASVPGLVDSTPAVTDAQIFLSDGHGQVHAFARDGGELQWSVRVDPHPEAHLWSSPIYLPDAQLVVVGVASYEEVVVKPELSFRGSLVALEASSGRERWRVATTDPAAGDGPGIAIWATVAVDRARHALYVGTGNNYGQPASALSDAVLAIDYEQGELLWAEQLLPGDVFSLVQPTGPDYDIGSTANLFTADGVDLVGIGSKSGAYVALDRDSGEQHWLAQVSPGGLFGGVLGAGAYADGVVYVAGNDPQVGDAVIAALDAATGVAVWQQRLPSATFSHLAHAGGVVFAGDLSGRIAALDAANGETLWTDTLPDVVGSAAIAHGMLFVSYGYPISVGDSQVGKGGVIAYRVP